MSFLSKTESKLIRINLAWNELENDMGENAALEVACEQEGVTSEWFYENFANSEEVVNRECSKVWNK